MTIISKSIASLLMVSTVTAPAVADVTSNPAASSLPAEADPMSLARQFLSITYSGDSFYNTLKETSLAAAEAFSEADGDADVAKINDRIERYLKAAEPIIRKHASLILEIEAASMARTYSPSELRELVAFASSTTGKKYLTTTDGTQADPAVMGAYMKMHEEMQPLLLELQKTECAAKAQQRLAMGDKNAHCPLADEDNEAAGQD